MPDIDTGVIIVGAAPTGLMLAGELRLAGVNTLVLERLTEPWAVPKAGGLGGQILDLLHYRGLLDQFEAASGKPGPAPRFPFGGLPVDLTNLTDCPMQALLLPQPQIEALLEELAREAGADIRRGHQVVGLSQDDTTVTADVAGPDGPYRLTARYLVGCDGVGSRIRDLADIAFPGITYPEVHRLGSFTMPDSVTLLDDGDYDAAHQFPSGGVAVNAGMMDTVNLAWKLAGTFAPDLTLHTDHGTTTVASLMHTARPVLLDLADRADLREIAGDWHDRVDVHTAETDDPPADAILIRPDAYVAWAATVDEPVATAAPGLRQAMSYWFGDASRSAR